MMGSSRGKYVWIACSTALLVLGALAGARPLNRMSRTAKGAAARSAIAQAASPASDPWNASQTIQPKQLADYVETANAPKPIVICAGVRTLYEGAHVPGAHFEGPASSKEGLAKLEQWARTLPRNVNIVVYCGCCPLARCPNIRPAFAALESMGFHHVRVLLLPKDFATDWVAKGYPIRTGLDNR